jgi:hypothetical protein
MGGLDHDQPVQEGYRKDGKGEKETRKAGRKEAKGASKRAKAHKIGAAFTLC